MIKLVKTNVNSNSVEGVSCRELYNGLGLDRSNFPRWSNSNITNSEFFELNRDYTPLVIMTNGNETIDFIVSLEMAKHMAMMARTSKSHEYRNYFIELERKQLQPTLPDFSNPIIAARAWADEVESKQQALLKIEEDRPKVDFHDLVTEAEGELLGRFAKVFGMGRNKFYALLRNDGYLQLDNMPYQRYIKQGIFEVRESKPYVDRGGVVHTVYQTLLTGKGQIYFTKRYFSKEYTAE